MKVKQYYFRIYYRQSGSSQIFVHESYPYPSVVYRNSMLNRCIKVHLSDGHEILDTVKSTKSVVL